MRSRQIFFQLILIVVLIVPAYAQNQNKILQLKEQIIEIQNQGQLGFSNFSLCSNIIGYGQYVKLATPQVKAGSELKVYYEPVNLFTNRQAGTYQLWYTQDLILLTDGGEELYNGNGILNFNYQTTSPVFDTYATNSLSLGNLPAGKYVLKAVIHDKLKPAEAVYIQKFEIVK